MKHKGEDGNECTQHPTNSDALMTFAVIGSRVSAFNHDIASKLQGMMMALDEIEELLERVGDSDLRRATETAQQSLKEASASASTSVVTCPTLSSRRSCRCSCRHSGSRSTRSRVRGAAGSST